MKRASLYLGGGVLLLVLLAAGFGPLVVGSRS